MFRDVGRNTSQLQIGAVDHGAFAAAFLRTYQILEALPAQTAPIVLLTCRGKRKGRRQGGREETEEREGGKEVKKSQVR